MDNSGNLYFAAEDVRFDSWQGLFIGQRQGFEMDSIWRAAAQATHPVLDRDGKLYQVLGFKLYKIGL